MRSNTCNIVSAWLRSVLIVPRVVDGIMVSWKETKSLKLSEVGNRTELAKIDLRITENETIANVVLQGKKIDYQFSHELAIF